MASVEDFPFADLKYGSFDMNASSFGYPNNPEMLSLGLFDGLDQMSSNMAYLEEDVSSPVSEIPLQQHMTLNPPSTIIPHSHNMPVHVLPMEHQQQLYQPLPQPQPQHPHQHPQQHQPLQMTPHQYHDMGENGLLYAEQPQQLIPHQSQFDGFPPVHAFVPPISTPVNTIHEMEFQTPQRSRNMSEADIMETLQSNFRGSPLSLSPDSIMASSVAPSYSSAPSSTEESDESFQRYKVIRGISSGGSATKPPRVVTLANHHYAPVNLELVGATLHDLCLPQWTESEKIDRRRIIRVERYQVGPRIVAQFSIVGSAKENPKTRPSQAGVDVVEVSCLECYTGANDDEDESSEPEYGYKTGEPDFLKRAFYITSVEVIKVVELLIGTEVQDAVERRRERGRIRSNLVPFWSKKPISSRMSSQEGRSSPLGNEGSLDFRVELATRIMSYDIRKPRGFDKEVRILKWEKLVPALKRALQSYYVEIPDNLEEDS